MRFPSAGVAVASEEKSSRIRNLVDVGKEKGYLLYDDVSEILPDDLSGGGNLEDILTGSQAKWGCSESMRWKTVVPVLPAPTTIIGPLLSITNSSYPS